MTKHSIGPWRAVRSGVLFGIAVGFVVTQRLGPIYGVAAAILAGTAFGLALWRIVSWVLRRRPS